MTAPDIGSQVTIAAVAVWFIQWLKGSRFAPWIDHTRQFAQVAVATATAGMGALGLHWAFDAEAGRLVIEGLTAQAMLAAAWAWLQAFAMQEVVYRGAVKKAGGGQGGGSV